MKKLLLFLLLILLLAVAGGAWYALPRMPIISGYAAKMMCSCYFVADMDAEQIRQEDLGFSLIKYAKTAINEADKTVTATVYGLGKQTAVYREGLGCTLVPKGYTVDDLKAQPFSPVPVLPQRPDTLAWPMGTLLPDTLPGDVNMDQLKTTVAAQFDQADAAREKNTRAVVVVYKGQLIHEEYAKSFDPNVRILGWSMTKSITNALVGIRVRQGEMQVNAPAPISDWAGDDRQAITLHNLLQMSSGLQWEEEYSDISDATKMLYLEGDMFASAIDNPPATEPDGAWVYSSGTSNILSGLVRYSFNELDDYWTFPRRELFNKIGMRSAVLEPDASGTFVGSSYCYATPRDWARFGLLYANDGIWQGSRIFPEGWVDYSIEEASKSAGEYGAQIWLNAGGKLPDAPRDMYSFNGFNGQRVFIMPSKDLIVVRMGLSPDGTFDFNAMLKEILSAFPE